MSSIDGLRPAPAFAPEADVVADVCGGVVLLVDALGGVALLADALICFATCCGSSPVCSRWVGSSFQGSGLCGAGLSDVCGESRRGGGVFWVEGGGALLLGVDGAAEGEEVGGEELEEEVDGGGAVCA